MLHAYDGTLERTPITPGDTVRVIAYGYGARLADVGRTGTVTGIGRTRVRVRLDGDSLSVAIGPACLKVLGATPTRWLDPAQYPPPPPPSGARHAAHA